MKAAVRKPLTKPQPPAIRVLNTEQATSATDEAQRQLRPYFAPVFFFIVGCLFSIPPIINAVQSAKDNKDYLHWYSIGQWVLEGKPLYETMRNNEPEYMYPPTAAVLFYAPLCKLGPVGFVVTLGLLNSIAWGFALWATWELVANQELPQSRWRLIFPGLAAAAYIWDIQLLGQTNLLLLSLTLGAFVLNRYHRPLLGSGFFGTAVAMKAFPLPAIAYFVVRKQWLAVAGTMLSIAAMVWFLPGVVRGFDRNTAEVKQWVHLMIGDQSGEKMAGRSTIGFTRRNQSIVSCSHRLLRHLNAGDDPRKPLYVNVANVSPATAQLIGYSICLILGLVLLISCRLQFGQTREAEGLEVAMVCVLVPLCSPLAWTYFFCWLLPAWTAVAYWFQSPRLTPTVRTYFRRGTFLTGGLLASAVTEQIDPTLQACGVTALGSITLFLTLAYLRFHLPATGKGPALALAQ